MGVDDNGIDLLLLETGPRLQEREEAVLAGGLDMMILRAEDALGQGITHLRVVDGTVVMMIIHDDILDLEVPLALDIPGHHPVGLQNRPM